jgi:hypothetical protein
MKVALCSDIITWIGEGEISDQTPAPDAVIDPEGPVYTNLALQGGTYLLVTHPEFAAAYVQNNDGYTKGGVTATLTNIKMLPKPISTQGA